MIEGSKDSHSQAIMCVSALDNRKNSISSLEERVAQVTHFLHDFTKARLEIASEIFDEITKRWEAQGSVVASRDFQISLDSHLQRAEITGKRLCVDAEMKKMEDLVKAVKEDTEFMKTVVEVVEDSFPAAKLQFLKASGISETLRDDQRHVAISVDSIQKWLKMKGPLLGGEMKDPGNEVANCHDFNCSSNTWNFFNFLCNCSCPTFCFAIDGCCCLDNSS